jgi:hypothetical protein
MAVRRIEKNLGYELATVLISSFCHDLLVNELPTLSHQPVSMAHCLCKGTQNI